MVHPIASVEIAKKPTTSVSSKKATVFQKMRKKIARVCTPENFLLASVISLLTVRLFFELRTTNFFSKPYQSNPNAIDNISAQAHVTCPVCLDDNFNPDDCLLLHAVAKGQNQQPDRHLEHILCYNCFAAVLNHEADKSKGNRWRCPVCREDFNPHVIGQQIRESHHENWKNILTTHNWRRLERGL